MVWVIMFVLAFLGEAVTGAFISIWFAGGAVAGYVALSLGASLAIQIIVFLIGSGLSMLAIKPLRDRHIKKGIIKTNVDAMIGETALVMEDISNFEGKGAVMFKGLEYTARSVEGDLIQKDEKVSIERIEGVKLIVSKAKEQVTTKKHEQGEENL